MDKLAQLSLDGSPSAPAERPSTPCYPVSPVSTHSHPKRYHAHADTIHMGTAAAMLGALELNAAIKRPPPSPPLSHVPQADVDLLLSLVDRMAEDQLRYHPTKRSASPYPHPHDHASPPHHKYDSASSGSLDPRRPSYDLPSSYEGEYKLRAHRQYSDAKSFHSDGDLLQELDPLEVEAFLAALGTCHSEPSSPRAALLSPHMSFSDDPDSHYGRWEHMHTVARAHTHPSPHHVHTYHTAHLPTMHTPSTPHVLTDDADTKPRWDSLHTDQSGSDGGEFDVHTDMMTLRKRRRPAKELARSYRCPMQGCGRRYEACRSLQHHMWMHHKIRWRKSQYEAYIRQQRRY